MKNTKTFSKRCLKDVMQHGTLEIINGDLLINNPLFHTIYAWSGEKHMQIIQHRGTKFEKNDVCEYLSAGLIITCVDALSIKENKAEKVFNFFEKYANKKRQLVIANFVDLECLVVLNQMGIHCVVEIPCEGDFLSAALSLALAGGSVLPQRLVEELSCIYMARPSTNWPIDSRLSLTKRERDVLRCLQAGKSNKTISKDLGMQEATVKVHVRQVLRKLGVENRTQAALIGDRLVGDNWCERGKRSAA